QQFLDAMARLSKAEEASAAAAEKLARAMEMREQAETAAWGSGIAGLSPSEQRRFGAAEQAARREQSRADMMYRSSSNEAKAAERLYGQALRPPPPPPPSREDRYQADLARDRQRIEDAQRRQQDLIRSGHKEGPSATGPGAGALLNPMGAALPVI